MNLMFKSDQGQRIRNIGFKAGLLIGGLLFLYQIGKTAQSLVATDYGEFYELNFLLALVIGFVLSSFQLYTWKVILTFAGADIDYKDSMKGYYLSSLPRFIPGSIWGYISRAEWFSQKANISHSMVNYGSIIEVVSYIIATLCLVAYSVIIHSGNGNILGLFFVATLISLSWLIYKLASRRIQLFHTEHLIGFYQWVYLIFLQVIYWVLFGMIMLCLFKTIDPLFSSNIFILSGAYAFAWLIGFVIIVIPSGFGIRESLLILVLGYLVASEPHIFLFVAVGTRLIIFISESIWLIIGRYIK
jgi:glycosyltransferase 2 family protein